MAAATKPATRMANLAVPATVQRNQRGIARPLGCVGADGCEPMVVIMFRSPCGYGPVW
jgi:hypothetical protein